MVALLLVMSNGNWLQEQRLAPTDNHVNFDAIRQNPCLFCLGLLLLPILLILACGSFAHIPEHALLAIAAGASFIVIGSFASFIRPEISKPVVFFFIFRCLN